jgi:hypothetical protein
MSVWHAARGVATIILCRMRANAFSYKRLHAACLSCSPIFLHTGTELSPPCVLVSFPTRPRLSLHSRSRKLVLARPPARSAGGPGCTSPGRGLLLLAVPVSPEPSRSVPASVQPRVPSLPAQAIHGPVYSCLLYFIYGPSPRRQSMRN